MRTLHLGLIIFGSGGGAFVSGVGTKNPAHKTHKTPTVKKPRLKFFFWLKRLEDRHRSNSCFKKMNNNLHNLKMYYEKMRKFQVFME